MIPQGPLTMKKPSRSTAWVQALPFASLSDGAATGKVRHFKRRQYVAIGGDLGRFVWLVQAGRLRVESVSAGGTRRIHRLMGPGRLLGLELFERAAYDHDVVACTAVTLLEMSLQSVQSLAPTWGIADLPTRWRAECDAEAAWAAVATVGPARQRVLRLLQRVACDAGHDGEVDLPHRQDMSDLLGMTLETASRQLGQLQLEGVLTLYGPRRGQIHRRMLQTALLSFP